MTFPGSNHVREYPDQPDHKFGSEASNREGVARYKLAALLVKDDDVLDIGCGSGYGPEIMSAAGAKSVTAIDMDPEAIEYCRWHFKRTKVDYGVADARYLLPWSRSYDVIINHGTLQFNEPEDQHKVLSNIRELLRPAGVAMLSVNYNVYTGPDTTRAHPFHIWAFDRQGLMELLSRHFDHFKVVVQLETLFYETSNSGTTWIMYVSQDPHAFLLMQETMEPYLKGKEGKCVDLTPTWREAI